MARRQLTTEERNQIYDQTGGGEAYTLGIEAAETAHYHSHECKGCDGSFHCESVLCNTDCHVLCCDACDTYGAMIERAPAAYFARRRHA